MSGITRRSRTSGSLLATAIVLAGTTTAHAQLAPRPLPVTVDVPVQTPPQAEVSSRLIYMRRCPMNIGCVIRPGNEDSRLDTSTIPNSQVTLTGFKQGDAVWAQLMTCMRATYAPFNIGITDVDPGNVPHFENVVGGRGTELSPDLASAGGVAPFTCDEIPNAITFTFDVYGPDADTLCWTAAQETAHAFGLEHEYNASDPMTYLNGGPSMKRFQPTSSPCGEFSAASNCRCTGAPTQNSYQTILGFFGPGVPTAPTIAIKSPTSGKKVQPRFVVRVAAMDDVGIDRIELWVDGINTGVVGKMPPYQVTAPETISQGSHSVEIKGFDVQGTVASDSIDVDVGPPCTASKGCSGTDVCVVGVCVAGPEQPGGLGHFCSANTECLSNLCIGDEGGSKACVEACELGNDSSCPEDFSCIPGGSGGVCWLTGGGGCCDVGHGRNDWPVGSILLGLGVILLGRGRRPRSRFHRS